VPRLWIDERYCKGCLICIDVCPKKVLGTSPGVNSKGYLVPIELDMSQCTCCGLCELMCPDFAIAIEKDQE
jgi:2-oxoglutarate ferredoxin oxidoreductase subunit delta